TSCTDTPQQNVVAAESKHRHIVETTRSFLGSADVPRVFWGEAVLTATYVINRIPTAHNSSLSPFEKLYGTLSDCSSLRLKARLRNLEGRELGLSDGSTKGKPKIEFYKKDQKTGGGAMITPAKTYNAATDSVLGRIKAEADEDEDGRNGIKGRAKEKKKKTKHVADKAAETQNEETIEAGEKKKKKRKHAETDEAETETPSKKKDNKKKKKKTKE
ncbi:probable nucleolar protein 5-2, partial [Tanacetum coccineum]